MSIPAQSGIWSFAGQVAKIGTAGTFTASSHTWHKMRTPRVTMGPVQDQQVFPLEVGGEMVPQGAFKQALFYAGDVDIYPRLEDNIGWLLQAALGDVTTSTDEDSDGNSVTGLNTHLFAFDSASDFTLPWLASRVEIPGVSAGYDSGEIGFDCKINGIRLTVPQMGKLGMRLGLQGRDIVFDNSPNSWAYDNASYEDVTTTPDAGRGTFKLGGTEYPITAMSIDMVNNLTTPQQEMIVGSFNPDDFVPLTRGVTLRFQYKYQNDDLCRLLYTGSADGTEWSSLPYELSTVGNDYAMDAIFLSPKNIGATGMPYMLRIRANKIVIAKDGPTQLQAGNILLDSYTVTVVQPSSGNYIEFLLENDASAYAWPS